MSDLLSCSILVMAVLLMVAVYVIQSNQKKNTPTTTTNPSMSADDLTRNIFPRFEECEEEKDAYLEGQVQEVDMSSWLSPSSSSTPTTLEPPVSVKVKELEGGLMNGLGVILENILTREECLSIIERTEKMKYGRLGKGKTGQAYRGNRRVQIEDTTKQFTTQLWERIEPHLSHLYSSTTTNETSMPDDDGIWKCDGLNPRYRFAKYSKGEGFAVHKDKPTIYEQEECSFYTVNIYLNDLASDQGGETRFYEKMQSKQKLCSAGGLAGSVVIFKQSQFPNSAPHDGELLKYGVKYLMRTDVVFKKVG